MGRSVSKEEKERIIENFKTSGVTKTKYAIDNGIPVSTFCKWYRKVNGSDSVDFVEVTDKVKEANTMLTLKIDDGIIEFPVSSLIDVIKALKQC